MPLKTDERQQILVKKQAIQSQLGIDFLLLEMLDEEYLDYFPSCPSQSQVTMTSVMTVKVDHPISASANLAFI